MRRGSLAAAIAFALVCFVAGAARADDVACSDAYAQAQVQRRAGKLRDAKRELLACAQESCSGAIRSDCLKWTEEVERALSTVVFDVRLPDGSEITDVRVYVGAELVVASLDGRQVALDPGEVTLRFVRGAQSIEKRVVIREGEKFRALRVEFPPPAGAAAKTTPKSPPEQPVRAEPRDAGVPTFSWVMGGVSVAAFATFGVLAIDGFAREQSLRDSCLPTRSCAHADVQSVRTQYLIGDIALGVGVVTLGVGLGYWLVKSASRGPSGSLGAR